jgi:tol-pal system protein YbgF
VTGARTLCLFFAVGCASPMSTLRSDNQRLSHTVTELRGDRRAQDRKLRDLQHQIDELRAKAAVGVLGTVPVLPVEVAAPGPAASAGAPAGPLAPPPDAPRVVAVTDDGTEIVYEGDAAAGRPATLPASTLDPASAASPASESRMARGAREPARNDDDPPARRSPARRAPPALLDVPVVSDRLEVTRRVPAISARTSRGKTRDLDAASERGGDAAADYRAAVDLVKAGKHDDAVAALRAFVARHPRHDYADNAQYWLGEAFYAAQDYGRALAEFRKVVEVYPRGNKVPDALLKVGYCHHAMGQREKAHAVLEQVVNLYPRSEPAMLAAKRLETP